MSVPDLAPIDQNPPRDIFIWVGLQACKMIWLGWSRKHLFLNQFQSNLTSSETHLATIDQNFQLISSFGQNGRPGGPGRWVASSLSWAKFSNNIFILIVGGMVDWWTQCRNECMPWASKGKESRCKEEGLVWIWMLGGGWVVNCPTRWSFIFVFVFHIWISVLIIPDNRKI